MKKLIKLTNSNFGSGVWVNPDSVKLITEVNDDLREIMKELKNPKKTMAVVNCPDLGNAQIPTEETCEEILKLMGAL